MHACVRAQATFTHALNSKDTPAQFHTSTPTQACTELSTTPRHTQPQTQVHTEGMRVDTLTCVHPRAHLCPCQHCLRGIPERVSQPTPALPRLAVRPWVSPLTPLNSCLLGSKV